MPDISWKDKLIIGEKIIIGYVLLRAWYAPHLHTVFEPKFEQEPEPESQQITNPFLSFGRSQMCYRQNSNSGMCQIGRGKYE